MSAQEKILGCSNWSLVMEEMVPLSNTGEHLNERQGHCLLTEFHQHGRDFQKQSQVVIINVYSKKN